MERDLAPDWILNESIEVQRQANLSWRPPAGNGTAIASNASMETKSDLTLTVLGCGTMGIAILGGIMDSLSNTGTSNPLSDGAKASPGSAPSKLPTTFKACVRTPEGAKRIRAELGKYEAFKNLTIHENENVKPVQDADVILVACKPYMVQDIFAAPDMQSACRGKLLLSICAGITEEQIKSCIGPEATETCRVVRVMPNTAAAVRESMTVVATSDPPLPTEMTRLITWIFTRIGRVVHLPSSTMDASTALCGSGPAFGALFVDSMAAGGIAMGLPREEAYMMAAQTLRGTTELVLKGEHPAVLKDKVTTPGGCTIGGLLVLEEGAVKGTIAKAVREATEVAGRLGGQGKYYVNGTRAR